MLRQQFDTWAPPGSPLRQLASKIARLEAKKCPTFLSRTGREPCNILANAELSDSWTPPVNHTKTGVLKWKGTPAALHGFSSKTRSSARGLALLFDPFADAFLTAHFSKSGVLPQGCTVLVLTDYYPSVDAECAVKDWAGSETEAILGGRISGRNSTANQLFDSLFGKTGWRKQGDKIAEGICGRDLLLWNFFPMFRGGDIPTGSSGLPLAGDWRLRCWELLSEFLVAVGATRTVLASSQAMLPLIGMPPMPIDQSTLTVPGVRTPLPALPVERGVYRISHPSSWKRVRNDGPQLNALLSS
jgi:hypothetical protein